MSSAWAEVLQQIRHQSVDLLLICLGESAIPKEMLKALKALGDLPINLPPILILDRQLNSSRTKVQAGSEKLRKNALETIETVGNTISAQILPRSISMEELLNEVNQSLAIGRNHGKG